MDSTDVGSLPLEGDRDRFLRGASHAKEAKSKLNEETLRDVVYFEATVTHGLLDKLGAGLTVPTYPQFRDMNEMFLSMFSGLKRLEGRYVEVAGLGVKDPRIPEVLVVREAARELAEELGLDKVRIRVCITGPHTLSFQFAFRSPGLLRRLGHVLAKVAETNLASDKHFEVAMLTVDEPTFGTVDDRLLERGSEGREALLEAWEEILRPARAKGIITCFHLHSTIDDLFWQVENLRLVESHVGDPLYGLEETKALLDRHDKALRASICKADFDELVRARIKAEFPDASEAVMAERLGEAWKAIRAGRLDPISFIEDVKVMAKRLREILKRFGSERVPFAGPECGLRGFPAYGSAIECLRRVVRACQEASGSGY